MRRPAILVAAALAFVACAGENSLSGSVGALFDLDVSRVEVLRNEEALQVTYFRNRAAEVDVVVRVTVALQDVELQPGARIRLEGEYEPGHLRTTVAHAPGGEAVRIFPPVRKGDLVLASGGNPGEATRGDFSMSFEDEGGDIGQGRTLVGNFAGLARDAGF